MKNRILFSLMFFSLLIYGEASAGLVTTQEGCKIDAFGNHLNLGHFITWNGACANGYAQGYGQLSVYSLNKHDAEGKFIERLSKPAPGDLIVFRAIGTTKDGLWVWGDGYSYQADFTTNPQGNSYVRRVESFNHDIEGRPEASLNYIINNGNEKLYYCFERSNREGSCSNPSDVEARLNTLKSEMESRLNRKQSNSTAKMGNYAANGDQSGKAEQSSTANKESKVKLKGEPANHCIEAEFVQTSTGEMSYFKNKCGYKVKYTWCVVNPPKESNSGMFRCKTGGGNFFGGGADSIKPYGRSSVFLKGDRYHFFACKDPSSPSVRYTGDGLKGGCR